MKSSKMASIILITLVLSLTVIVAIPVVWSGTDVYLIYSGKNKDEKKALVKAFPRGISVRSYNADLLAVSDYSGIQKAVSRFERAKIIVILRDRPVTLLEGAELKKDLLIVQSVKSGVSSIGWKLYILTKNHNLFGLGGRIKKRIITRPIDLDDIEGIRASDLLLIDEKGIEMPQAVARLIENYLDLE